MTVEKEVAIMQEKLAKIKKGTPVHEEELDIDDTETSDLRIQLHARRPRSIRLSSKKGFAVGTVTV